MANDQQALGEFEQLVLLAVLRTSQDDREAYGISVYDELVARTKRRVARGAVYMTLDRLEKKGYLESWLADVDTVDENSSLLHAAPISRCLGLGAFDLASFFCHLADLKNIFLRRQLLQKSAEPVGEAGGGIDFGIDVDPARTGRADNMAQTVNELE